MESEKEKASGGEGNGEEVVSRGMENGSFLYESNCYYIDILDFIRDVRAFHLLSLNYVHFIYTTINLPFLSHSNMIPAFPLLSFSSHSVVTLFLRVLSPSLSFLHSSSVLFTSFFHSFFILYRHLVSCPLLCFSFDLLKKE